MSSRRSPAGSRTTGSRRATRSAPSTSTTCRGGSRRRATSRARRRAPVPEEFQYALLRVVPDIERGEALNAGVVLFSRRARFLAARVGLDEERLNALAPGADADAIGRHLDSLAAVAAGDPDAGPIARPHQSERFAWLVPPASTVVQPSPVHTGFCGEPQERLDALFERLVAR